MVCYSLEQAGLSEVLLITHNLVGTFVAARIVLGFGVTIALVCSSFCNPSAFIILMILPTRLLHRF